MKKGSSVPFRISNIILCCQLFLFFLPSVILGDESYTYQGMWPVSQQQWNFLFPENIAISSQGDIYVADAGNYRVQVFSPNGSFITQWGSFGTENGQFDRPTNIAIDKSDNIYVLDSLNHSVSKFSSSGEFLVKWGSQGDGQGQFNWPGGIAASADNSIYVADSFNFRIQKFTSGGQYLSEWGHEGTEPGAFQMVESAGGQGIVVDETGNVYLADSGNCRIQKFTSDGAFLAQWGSCGSGDGSFRVPDVMALGGDNHIFVLDHQDEPPGSERIQEFSPDGDFVTSLVIGGVGDGRCVNCSGLAVGDDGALWVSDRYAGRIQKLKNDGTFVMGWGTDGSGSGEFFKPAGVAVDGNGVVYIADSLNHRIQKFNEAGVYIYQWGTFGSANGELNWPEGIAAGPDNSIYIADSDNHRVQKFTANGQFLAKWGAHGTKDGEFDLPIGITVDALSNVYVSEMGNSRIQKFTPDGRFVTKWGAPGINDGEFAAENFIDISAGEFIYALDTGNHRIQMFSLEGDFIKEWGGFGHQNGEFAFTGTQPNGISVDQDGNVYVVDAGNFRVQKFNQNGEFITSFGSYGYDPGQLTRPSYIFAHESGRVYISDFGTNRIQIYSNGEVPSDRMCKAILVAGGGPYSGNILWTATQMCANYAYRVLIYQGYTKENIYYLSADTDLDLDGNGILDDVDTNATNADLQYAIQTWAQDADELFIYMVDHGGNGTFRMGETELLYARDLDTWLDRLQQTLSGPITMVYDACESGSFLPHLIPPTGKQRILATSASPGEESIFVGNGTVSFSFLFWGHMFNGERFYDAFVSAKKSVSTTYNQTALLDANGNGIGNEKADKDMASLIRIGNETKSAGDVPVIGSVSPHQDLENTASALIYADQVVDADGISRVWAVITPPGYSPGSTETPVTDLPTIDLSSVGNNRFETVYTQFTSSGTYNIVVFALDRKGVLSLPVQTSVTHNTACLTVGNDLGIRVPCAEYNGSRYSFLLDFYRHPDDPSGFYWKLVMGTLSAGEAGDCISIDPNLTMAMPCVCYDGVQYGFTLNFYQNPYDPSGLYWRMDKSSLVVK